MLKIPLCIIFGIVVVMGGQPEMHSLPTLAGTLAIMLVCSRILRKERDRNFCNGLAWVFGTALVLCTVHQLVGWTTWIPGKIMASMRRPDGQSGAEVATAEGRYHVWLTKPTFQVRGGLDVDVRVKRLIYSEPVDLRLRDATAASTSAARVDVFPFLGMSVGADLHVTETVPGGPAARAGIRVGDVITAVGDHASDHTAHPQLIAAMRGVAGAPVDITLQRLNASYKVTLIHEVPRR